MSSDTDLIKKGRYFLLPPRLVTFLQMLVVEATDEFFDDPAGAVTSDIGFHEYHVRKVGEPND